MFEPAEEFSVHHVGLLTPFLELLHIGIDCLCFEEVPVWESSSSPQPLCLPGQPSWDPDKSLKKPQSALLRSKTVVLLCLPHFSVEFEILNHPVTVQHLRSEHPVRNKPADVSTPPRRDSLVIFLFLHCVNPWLRLSCHRCLPWWNHHPHLSRGTVPILQWVKENFCVAGSKRFRAFPPVGA